MGHDVQYNKNELFAYFRLLKNFMANFGKKNMTDSHIEDNSNFVKDFLQDLTTSQNNKEK